MIKMTLIKYCDTCKKQLGDKEQLYSVNIQQASMPSMTSPFSNFTVYSSDGVKRMSYNDAHHICEDCHSSVQELLGI